MTLCRCLHQQTPRDEPELDHLEDLDLLSAGKYLRKVALRVPEVRMKLAINRIVHFLEHSAARQLEPPGQQFGQSLIHLIQPEEKTPREPHTTPTNKENLTDLNEPESFVGIATSRSFLSELSGNHELAFPPGHVLSASPKILQFKQVVTKNSLEEEPVRHVRFQSAVESEPEESRLEAGEVVAQLEEENRGLERCLRSLFSFFEQRQLMESGSTKELQGGQWAAAAQQLTSNFVDYTRQIQERMDSLSAKSSLLQETVHNMSISLRIDPAREQPPAQPAQTDPQPTQAVQTDPQPDPRELEQARQELEQARQELEQTRQQLEQARESLSLAAEAGSRSEVLLYLKEEQVCALKTLVGDLENKLRLFSSGCEKARSRSYKKFFETTGEDLSRSTR